MSGWGHFPPSWVLRDRGLVEFSAGPSSGVHIAALKCYLAIASILDFNFKTAVISITELEGVTGCSRPMVVNGIKVLEGHGLVVVDRSRRVHCYTLLGFENVPKPAFSKVPKSVQVVLQHLPNRGETALSAIKILMLLLALRDVRSSTARVGHERIRDYCGMQPRYVRPGIDHLVNHRILHVAEEQGRRSGHPFNVYTIRGDFEGARQRPAAVPQRAPGADLSALNGSAERVPAAAPDVDLF